MEKEDLIYIRNHNDYILIFKLKNKLEKNFYEIEMLYQNIEFNIKRKKDLIAVIEIKNIKKYKEFINYGKISFSDFEVKNKDKLEIKMKVEEDKEEYTTSNF